jgi:hypothetical protein
MNDDAHELILVWYTQHVGIAFHGVERNDHITRDVAGVSVVKRDNVCVIVMPKKFAVGGKDVFVIAKDIGQASNALAMLLCHLHNPVLHGLMVQAGHLDIALSHVIDFGHSGLSFEKRDTKITHYFYKQAYLGKF